MKSYKCGVIKTCRWVRPELLIRLRLKMDGHNRIVDETEKGSNLNLKNMDYWTLDYSNHNRHLGERHR